MELTLPWWLIPSFALIAVLYSSVGHGGASGYLAILAFLPGAIQHPEQMASTALTLNLLVAGSGLVAFARAGYLVPALTWPFLVTSIPAAFLGGFTRVPVHVYALLLAGSLMIAAWRLTVHLKQREAEQAAVPSMRLALPIGAGIGWLSGVVGVGGGIFLSPVLLLAHWATAKQTAATAACFILINSAAGLAGRCARGAVEYGALWPLLAAAFAGGVIGSRLGARHLSGMSLKRMLAVVLVIASFKLLRLAI